MNNEMKQKWIDALRSGEYEQGKGYLKSNPNGHSYSHCCLGVLCEISGFEQANYDVTSPIFHSVDFMYEGGQYYILLPEQFRKNIDLCFEDQNTLTEMNDSGNYSFEDIANWIEENL